ncbi:MAG: beta-hydroxyacyl-ACP dehydratase [Planctomycetes bacterium]|nr:beta-hydroxyacyl-ACP dehydratase [Planctomycetota bacterium]
MGKKDLILDPSEYDLDNVIADIEVIRSYNRQRYEMEQLTAICYEDPERRICVGYKDLGPNEFWVRGHMPGAPIMPGVVMCETAAQLASYFTQRHKLMDAPVVGFAGLKDVRFRGVVHPGERFVIVAQLLKIRRMMLTSQFQCFVHGNMVCDGILKGIPLPEDVINGSPAE